MSGPTPLAERSLAPDLARGGMLLLIALANVHGYLYSSRGVRAYPADLAAADQVVVLVQMLLVDGRAIPLFALLFGYGITQLARRRAAAGETPDAAAGTVRRRGLWMLGIGFLHAVLLFSGDVVSVYGLVAALFAVALVQHSDGALIRLATAGVLVGALWSTVLAYTVPAGAPDTRSVAQSDLETAAAIRMVEWPTALLFNAMSIVGLVALGAWAARRRLLDDPAAHRTLLVRTAAVALPVAVLLGLPFALVTAESVAYPSLRTAMLYVALHTVGGFAGGVGYAAAFGLLALRVSRRSGGPGPVGSVLAATGRRSLSCYLAQSVAFVALLPEWTLGWGATATAGQAALLALGVWLVTVLVAAASERAGIRGPAETLLRRLTYGSARARPSGRP